MIGDKEQVELLEYLAHQYGYLFSMYVVNNALNKSEALLVEDAANFVRLNLFDEINDFQRVFSRDLTGMKAHKCKED